MKSIILLSILFCHFGNIIKASNIFNNRMIKIEYVNKQIDFLSDDDMDKHKKLNGIASSIAKILKHSTSIISNTYGNTAINSSSKTNSSSTPNTCVSQIQSLLNQRSMTSSSTGSISSSTGSISSSTGSISSSTGSISSSTGSISSSTGSISSSTNSSTTIGSSSTSGTNTTTNVYSTSSASSSLLPSSTTKKGGLTISSTINSKPTNNSSFSKGNTSRSRRFTKYFTTTVTV